MSAMKTETTQWKVDFVNDITTMIDTHPVVAVARINGIPAKQIQTMRENLRGSGILRVSKNAFFTKALSQATKKDIQKLTDFVDGQIAFFFTDMNPFRLFKKMEGTMAKAPAKGGEISPEDITIKKGDTPFKPGPIVGQFQKAGIPAAIEKGKIVIRKTVTPVKAGEVIPADLALMLTKLEIFPLTVGLDLRVVHEEGTLFTRDVLDVDVGEYRSNIRAAVSGAFNLAMSAGYPTSLTITPLLSLSHSQALNLAVNAGIINSKTLLLLIAKSQGRMLSLASHLNAEALDEELQGAVSGAGAAAAAPAAPADEGEKEGKKEEKKKDEKKEEESEEEEEVSEDDAVAGLGALFG